MLNVCVFVCLFWAARAIFSYLAAVTISSDRAANLDLCLALTAFSSDDSLTCHTYCDTGPPFLTSYSKDPWFSLLNAVIIAKEQSLPILNVSGLTRPAWAGVELTTSRMLSESTTTRLRQPVYMLNKFSTPQKQSVSKEKHYITLYQCWAFLTTLLIASYDG
jgi:hypothetical protein